MVTKTAVHSPHLYSMYDAVRISSVIGLMVVFFSACVPLVHAQESAVEDAVAAPVITSIAKSENEKNSIEVTGKSTPDATVQIEIETTKKEIIFRDNVIVASDGVWSLIISDASIPAGGYMLRAQTQLESGAVSKVTQARGFKVKPRPLLAIGAMEFGWFDVFLLFFFIVLAIAGVFAWQFERERRKREVYVMIAERDINNMCTLVSGEVDRLAILLKDAKGMEPHIASEADYLINSERATLEKMQGYLSAGVRKLR